MISQNKAERPLNIKSILNNSNLSLNKSTKKYGGKTLKRKITKQLLQISDQSNCGKCTYT